MSLFKVIKTFATVVNVGRALAYLFSTALPVITALIFGLLDSMPRIQIVFFVTGTFAVGLAAGIWMVEGYDYVVSRLGNRRVWNRVADTLQEMRDAEHEHIRIGDLATIWNDNKVVPVWEWNPKMRRLKAATNQKILSSVGAPKRASMNSRVSIDSAIVLFRSGVLKKIKGEK